MAAADPSAREAALTPPCALGPPLTQAQLRTDPQDFLVEEDLGFAPAGTGSHVLVKVRKVNANTQWVARELARFAGCRPEEVGYAGLKDRRAVAIQWLSVPRPRIPIDWLSARATDYEVLEAHPHTRKLPRGALAGNRFTIRLRPAQLSAAELTALLRPRLESIIRRGVPNYFGPQRFGRRGANLERLGENLRRMRPAERGFILSAARSALFNALLGARVTDGSWERVLAGDLASLEGRGSFFAVDEVDATLLARAQRLEIHPTGALWGAGPLPSAAAVAQLEGAVAARYPQLCTACLGAGMRQERRSLRLVVHELALEEEAGAAVLRFRLGRGSFATAVLHELIEAPEEAPEA